MNYIENHRSADVLTTDNPMALAAGLSVPETIKTKAAFRRWSEDATTQHAFLSYATGSAPQGRITAENPVVSVGGFIADYDLPSDRDTIKGQISKLCPCKPTYLATTYSDCVRLIWEFETPLRIDERIYESFMRRLGKSLAAEKLTAGFDQCSYRAAQFFEAGTDWEDTGSKIPEDMLLGILAGASSSIPDLTKDTEIPIEHVAAEVERKFPGRWQGAFDIGARGPLFWIDDGIDRVGCIVRPDGITAYSDRSPKGFLSWAEILGAPFVEAYTSTKLSPILASYWFDGDHYYRLMNGLPKRVPESQVKAELLESGLSTKVKPGDNLSEIARIVLRIQQQNRIDDAAPVLYSDKMMIENNGGFILNTNAAQAISSGPDGDPKNWPWLHGWLNQLFTKAGEHDALDYFYSWLSRFYIGTRDRKVVQGHALLLVGPSGRGKSLLSNRVIGALVGGFEDASRFLAARTNFSKKLAGVALWAVDDAIAASTFKDQQLMTEMLKKTVANPRLEYEPKYVDSVTIPWGGRVVMSLNEDANSLAVVPSMDSSNRDKTMALQISPDSSTEFPPNTELEVMISKELPYFARFLEEWEVPSYIEGDSRFGIKEYIAPTIEVAAFNNSSRSGIAEMVDQFCRLLRNEGKGGVPWLGTVTDLLSQSEGLGGYTRTIKPEFLRRGLSSMEQAHRSNESMRPVTSQGSGAGCYWIIDPADTYDIVGKQDEPVVVNGHAKEEMAT